VLPWLQRESCCYGYTHDKMEVTRLNSIKLKSLDESVDGESRVEHGVGVAVNSLA